MQALSELFFQFESTEFQREESSIIQQTLTRVNAKVDSSLEREETLIEKTLARVNDKLKSEIENSGLIQETLNRVSAKLNSRLNQAKLYVENIFTRVSATFGFVDYDANKDAEKKVHSALKNTKKCKKNPNNYAIRFYYWWQIV